MADRSGAPGVRDPLTVAIAWILLAYVAAMAVAALALNLSAFQPLVATLWADLLATGAIFLFSVLFRNSSFYDPYWSVAPPLIFGYWIWLFATGINLRVLVVALLVSVWAIRLTANWARGWQGLGHADWRYVQLQTKLRTFYWPVSLLGVHLLPTLIVFGGCLPLYQVAWSTEPLSGWDALGLLIGVGAVWLERRADLDLASFRNSRANSAQVLALGVWAWCRHPNYLGEIGFWLALACFGLGANSHAIWPLMGITAVVILFLTVSIPMIERKLEQDKGAYESYKRQTPMLIPRPSFRR